MTNSEKWNDIVHYYHKNKYSLEEEIQKTYERDIFHHILSYSWDEIDSQRTLQMASTQKKMDIVLQKDRKDIIVVELKQHSARKNDGGQAQLFSYLNQLKTVHIGILVCDRLCVYCFDFMKNDDENAQNCLEIPFTNDNSDGEKFVELFSKDNFDEEKIRQFVQERIKQKGAAIKIKEEITSGSFLQTAVKEYLKKSYDEEMIEKVLSDFQFSCIEKQKIGETEKSPSISASARTSNNEEHNKNDLDKLQIRELCIKNAVSIPYEFTKAKLNSGSPRYWANPNIKCLFREWWLVLVNTESRELYIFKIPANKIKEEQLEYKNEKQIDLQIYSDRGGYIDSRSGISFEPFLIKTIKY